ncbi:MAG: DUF2849 domain-containing protein [Neomegalonema sp.]|nr:DUF2849 domain-containing protein [Neomegalonema sp.]
MAKPYLPKVVTANDLLRGDVIWLDAQGGWVRSLAEAAVFDTPQTAEAALKSAAAQVDKVVGAYLADIRLVGGEPEPVHFREEMRVRGAFANLDLTP